MTEMRFSLAEAPEHAERVARLRSELTRMLERLGRERSESQPIPDVDDETRRQLESLGYFEE